MLLPFCQGRFAQKTASLLFFLFSGCFKIVELKHNGKKKLRKAD